MSASSSPGRPVRVLLACSGLEHARRGFESFARECFETLRDEPRLELELVKASGEDGNAERAVAALTRDMRLTRALSRASGRPPIHIEQLGFALSLQPTILRRRPDVVYFSEWYTGVGLNLLRRVNRQNYALVLSNGSMAATGFKWFDRVHEHTAPAYDYVLERGADRRRHILLPVAFRIPSELYPPSGDERRALRDRHGLPTDRVVVTSVAALNRWHKRLDYVIEEVANLPEPRPYLLLVGQPEEETEGLRALARERLGEPGHSFRTVSPADVDELLRASDVFVLASLAEGLPRALVEASARGILCLAHDYPVADYALGGHGELADFTQRGSLTRLLHTVGAQNQNPALGRQRHRYVYDNFSWDVLRPRYVEMLVGAVGRVAFGPNESARPRSFRSEQG